MNSVRPSSPPSMQAKQGWSVSTLPAPGRPRRPARTPAAGVGDPDVRPRRRGRCRRVPSRSRSAQHAPVRQRAVGGDVERGEAATERSRRRSACVPSGVMTVPLGKCSSVGGDVHACRRARPAPARPWRGRRACRPRRAGRARVEVEPEVADVGAAAGVDHHVVAVERGDAAEVGVHDQSVVLEAQHPAIEHRHDQQRPSGSQPRPLGWPAPRPCVSTLPSRSTVFTAWS